MSAVAFDTLKFATQLQAGDFTPDQARAITSALTEAMTGAELATKSDLIGVRSDLRNEIQAVKVELQNEIAVLRTEVKSDLMILEQRMTIRLGVMLMAAATFIVAAIKYLPGAHP